MTSSAPRVDANTGGPKVFEIYSHELGRNPILDLVTTNLPNTDWSPVTTGKDLREFATAFEVHTMLNTHIS